MNRRILYGLLLLVLAGVTAWLFWPRGTHVIQMENTVLANAVFQVSNVDLKDRIGLPHDSWARERESILSREEIEACP